MNAITGQGFCLVASQEELLLRRRLLFRLLRDFDFAVPSVTGETITPLAMPDQRGEDLAPHPPPR